MFIWAVVRALYCLAVQFDLVLKMITSPAGAVAKYCDEHVCVSVCSARISPEPLND